MARKKKIHKYVNPRTSWVVCGKTIDSDDRYRWGPYENTFWRTAKKSEKCKHCLKLK